MYKMPIGEKLNEMMMISDSSIEIMSDTKMPKISLGRRTPSSMMLLCCDRVDCDGSNKNSVIILFKVKVNSSQREDHTLRLHPKRRDSIL